MSSIIGASSCYEMALQNDIFINFVGKLFKNYCYWTVDINKTEENVLERLDNEKTKRN